MIDETNILTDEEVATLVECLKLDQDFVRELPEPYKSSYLGDMKEFRRMEEMGIFDELDQDLGPHGELPFELSDDPKVREEGYKRWHEGCDQFAKDHAHLFKNL